MKKRFNAFFFFLLSVFFISCSNSVDSDYGKIVFNLPFGASGNVARADEIVVENPAYYVFEISFVDKASNNEIVKYGFSGEQITIDEANPGEWSVACKAYTIEDKSIIETIKLEQLVSYFKEVSDISTSVYFGEENFTVTAGKTSSVKLILKKQKNREPKELKVVIPEDYSPALFNEIDYSSFTYTVIYEDDELNEISRNIDVAKVVYKPVEQNQFGLVPVEFIYTENNIDVKTVCEIPVKFNYKSLPLELVDEEIDYKVKYGDDFGLNAIIVPCCLNETYYYRSDDGLMSMKLLCYPNVEKYDWSDINSNTFPSEQDILITKDKYTIEEDKYWGNYEVYLDAYCNYLFMQEEGNESYSPAEEFLPDDSILSKTYSIYIYGSDDFTLNTYKYDEASENWVVYDINDGVEAGTEYLYKVDLLDDSVLTKDDLKNIVLRNIKWNVVYVQEDYEDISSEYIYTETEDGIILVLPESTDKDCRIILNCLFDGETFEYIEFEIPSDERTKNTDIKISYPKLPEIKDNDLEIRYLNGKMVNHNQMVNDDETTGSIICAPCFTEDSEYASEVVSYQWFINADEIETETSYSLSIDFAESEYKKYRGSVTISCVVTFNDNSTVTYYKSLFVVNR